MKNLNDLDLEEVRGGGLMIAFDLPNKKARDNVIVECVREGLLVLGTGEKSIRVIPPYIIREEEADEGLAVIEKAVKVVSKKGFKHRGKICDYMGCAENSG